MATLLLIRHGRTKANADGVLAGWTPGVGLDEVGREQVERLAGRLDRIPLAALVTSPLERCQQTAAAVAALDGHPPSVVDERLGEVRYGDWEGKSLKVLAKDPLWKAVQRHPSAVRFPGEGGESLRAMAERAVGAAREWDARVEADHGPDAIWAAVSHGDVIKAIVADALGLHLDQFQRIVIDPCSISVVRYTPLQTFVVRVNDTGSDLSSLVVPRRRRRRRRRGEADSDAVVGGGAGAGGAGRSRE
ncbi:histidine phosphatase family protein [Thermasporomyces composti]|jgi:probable phosphomutase (TIGR03848 family)|uniref:Putative phosphomutase (TIGR03848 family) n=1 Tax=Thermasporomyces composti TaxID=696763 RepID=A0A3D9VA01_THECX|nr:histidine phosphatase family protein [Thermasporomyces composti]REF38337.1 putative phosphomutase (TIGR03848 family) [Thermasporomyces composti]